MRKKTFYASEDSPKPSVNWTNLTDIQRIEMLNEAIKKLNLSFNEHLKLVAANKDGQVVVRIITPLVASVRGTLLLNFEEFLKKHIDQGLTVWGEALGDKNSLRNLRGIEVKAL